MEILPRTELQQLRTEKCCPLLDRKFLNEVYPNNFATLQMSGDKYLKNNHQNLVLLFEKMV